jgi:hypothetical protein
LSKLLKPRGPANGLTAISEIVLDLARYEVVGVGVKPDTGISVELSERVQQSDVSNLHQVVELLHSRKLAGDTFYLACILQDNEVTKIRPRDV